METPVATIEPIVWLVQGTGVQVNWLPAGVTAVFSGDTLTISGTISTQGLNNPQIITSEGCSSLYMLMDMSVIVDPEFSCEVQGEDVILHWPGINATLEYGSEMFVGCTAADGFFDIRIIVLPDADSLVWSGLPTNTELTFDLNGTGLPYCFPGFYYTTCTITVTDVDENEQGELRLRAVPVGDRLELAASGSLGEVRIHDMLGALVLSQGVNARIASIPINALPAGSYLVRVVGADERVAVQRFIKE
ncbi:MAG: T9SS type A sorting domain-containing protein [Flavobacteriales bacterium]|nr:T9SS type A sorting domain-containing protein [Flavobacteriales bacterium]